MRCADFFFARCQRRCQRRRKRLECAKTFSSQRFPTKNFPNGSFSFPKGQHCAGGRVDIQKCSATAVAPSASRINLTPWWWFEIWQIDVWMVCWILKLGLEKHETWQRTSFLYFIHILHRQAALALLVGLNIHHCRELCNSRFRFHHNALLGGWWLVHGKRLDSAYAVDLDVKRRSHNERHIINRYVNDSLRCFSSYMQQFQASKHGLEVTESWPVQREFPWWLKVAGDSL